jgi:hypothetical protein
MKKETMASRKVLKKEFILGILFDAMGMLSLRCLFGFQMLFGHRWQHI